MSTSTKRTLKDAMADAESFRSMFPPLSYRRWEFGGSLRRGKAEVGDVEHVIEPATVMQSVGLFGEGSPVNAFWPALDHLLADGVIGKHVYGDTGNRWGDLYRGVDFHGFNHEIFVGTHGNWGSTLAIRTGPAEFSQRLVTGLLKNGYRNKDGKVWQCDPCAVSQGSGTRCAKGCTICQGTGLRPRDAMSVPTEQYFFQLAGMKFIEPSRR